MADPDRNGVSSAAGAFATYSLIPYLGILFCPGAVAMGGVAVLQSWRRQDPDQRAAGYTSIAAGIVVSGVQLILWWMMYRVPEWSKGF